MGLRYVKYLINSTLVSPLTKSNQNSMNLYRNMGSLGLNSANQEYIGTIKHHKFLTRCYLGIAKSLYSIFLPPVNV